MSMGNSTLETSIRLEFANHGFQVHDVDVRSYPEETIVVIYVPREQVEDASRLGNSLDSIFAIEEITGFVTVREVRGQLQDSGVAVKFSGVHDQRANRLVQVIQSGARTSESQPSLAYVADSRANLEKLASFRHNIIFGRRGAGKTALMVEGKRRLELNKELTIWLNMQSYRQLGYERAALGVVQEILDVAQARFAGLPESPAVAAQSATLSSEIDRQLAKETIDDGYVSKLAPRLQQILKRFLATTGSHLYIFLDDFYFIGRDEQIALLDLLHSFVRDSNAWLKIATIRHLTKWFSPGDQLGLEIPHDATAIDLDVTLEEPKSAQEFLEEVLKQHGALAEVRSITSLFTRESMDRLVIASGAVPRDYLTLASEAIVRAQSRTNARQVGVQDVNKAAGDAAKLKLQELEEDSGTWAQATSEALRSLSRFCLEERHWTFFRVSFRDKDEHPSKYDQLARLMDLRLIHLLSSSVSDVHRAGEKSEAYMIDMSQYSGDRLRHHLQVLNLRNGYLAVKETGTVEPERVGKTQRQLVTILRRAPLFSVTKLGDET
jgi:hypothetical protein